VRFAASVKLSNTAPDQSKTITRTQIKGSIPILLTDSRCCQMMPGPSKKKFVALEIFFFEILWLFNTDAAVDNAKSQTSKRPNSAIDHTFRAPSSQLTLLCFSSARHRHHQAVL
jgi:hypothetical protein